MTPADIPQFDPALVTRLHGKFLPHWRHEAATYFVTFRLGDSLPVQKREQWDSERRFWLVQRLGAEVEGIAEIPGDLHGFDVERAISMLSPASQRWYHRTYTRRYHELLDAGHGSCVLQEPNCAAKVMNSMLHFHGVRYELGDFVVMPNHIHALIAPYESASLAEVIRSWKTFSAREINSLLVRQGSLWQEDAYNHIVRSASQFDHYRQYIVRNPIRARLREDQYILFSTQDERDERDERDEKAS
jgi:REP element-mobilizing transposase RayT